MVSRPDPSSSHQVADALPFPTSVEGNRANNISGAQDRDRDQDNGQNVSVDPTGPAPRLNTNMSPETLHDEHGIPSGAGNSTWPSAALRYRDSTGLEEQQVVDIGRRSWRAPSVASHAEPWCFAFRRVVCS